jgi:hypothetical protein
VPTAVRTVPNGDDLSNDSDEVFHNPVDGGTYIAPGGWKVYSPEEPRPQEPPGGVTLGRITLLTSEAEFENRTSQNDLIAFIQEAVRLAQEPFGGLDERFDVLVQFTCRPDGHEVGLASQGEAPEDGLQQYFDALVAAKPLPVSDGELSFLVAISANGGA